MQWYEDNVCVWYHGDLPRGSLREKKCPSLHMVSENDSGNWALVFCFGWKTWRIVSLCLKLSASYISSGYFKSSCPLSTRLYPTYLRILEVIFLEQLFNFKRTFKLLCWKCKRWLLTCKASQREREIFFPLLKKGHELLKHLVDVVSGNVAVYNVKDLNWFCSRDAMSR